MENFGALSWGTDPNDHDAKPLNSNNKVPYEIAGGEGGIRTPDGLAPMPHFECGAFNHSATSPGNAWAPLGGVART